MKKLTINEQTHLIAIWHLREEAYGVAVRKIIIELTGRRPAFGTIYSILDQMEKKGYVASRKGEPTRQRGGHNKVFYSLTKEGKEALMESLEFQKRLRSYLPKQALKEKSNP